MFGSLMRGLWAFFLPSLWRQVVLLTETDGDNRGTIDPNG
jgi:hypothetical protein